MKKLSSRIVSTLALLTAVPSWAGPITYSGRQQIDDLISTYSVVTDGTQGKIVRQNVLSFTFSITNGQDTTSFDETSGNLFAIPEIGLFRATDLGLFIPAGSVGTSFALRNEPGFYRPAGLRFDSGTFMATLTPSPGDGSVPIINRFWTPPPGYIQNTPVATAISDVPEPASWGMMLLGFGLAGAVVRRRRTTVSFA